MTQITREALFTIWLSKVKIDKYEAIEKHVISIFGADVDHSKLRAHLQKLCFSFKKTLDQIAQEYDQIYAKK